jgi:hypothetical protein
VVKKKIRKKDATMIDRVDACAMSEQQGLVVIDLSKTHFSDCIAGGG